MIRFLTELGVGFAFVGCQYPVVIGGDEFRIDLLFYHLKLLSFVIQSRRSTANSVVSALLTVNLVGEAITLRGTNAAIDRGGEHCPVRRGVVSCGRPALE
ncbi:PDDEXK nuclease domain-containing protein [Streptomyces sp. NPDC046465]|uniref:PDDEXK nuclease domain-containing protein n=1 Tax=Streptomyces sp. NPDC046465 TaxID=3155810 RepID=UPI0033BFC46D